MSEVRPRDEREVSVPSRVSRNARLLAKASRVRELLRATAGDRRQELVGAALLRKDEAILDGLLEELRRENLP